jgi:hypothetical protein
MKARCRAGPKTSGTINIPNPQRKIHSCADGWWPLVASAAERPHAGPERTKWNCETNPTAVTDRHSSETNPFGLRFLRHVAGNPSRFGRSDQIRPLKIFCETKPSDAAPTGLTVGQMQKTTKRTQRYFTKRSRPIVLICVFIRGWRKFPNEPIQPYVSVSRITSSLECRSPLPPSKPRSCPWRKNSTAEAQRCGVTDSSLRFCVSALIPALGEH